MKTHVYQVTHKIHYSEVSIKNDWGYDCETYAMNIASLQVRKVINTISSKQIENLPLPTRPVLYPVSEVVSPLDAFLARSKRWVIVVVPDDRCLVPCQALALNGGLEGTERRTCTISVS